MDSVESTATLERLLTQRAALRRERDDIEVLTRVAAEEQRLLLLEMAALGTTPETLEDDLEADRLEASQLLPQYAESLGEWRQQLDETRRLYAELRGTV